MDNVSPIIIQKRRKLITKSSGLSHLKKIFKSQTVVTCKIHPLHVALTLSLPSCYGIGINVAFRMDQGVMLWWLTCSTDDFEAPGSNPPYVIFSENLQFKLFDVNQIFFNCSEKNSLICLVIVS